MKRRFKESAVICVADNKESHVSVAFVVKNDRPDLTEEELKEFAAK